MNRSEKLLAKFESAMYTPGGVAGFVHPLGSSQDIELPDKDESNITSLQMMDRKVISNPIKNVTLIGLPSNKSEFDRIMYMVFGTISDDYHIVNKTDKSITIAYHRKFDRTKLPTYIRVVSES